MPISNTGAAKTTAGPRGANGKPKGGRFKREFGTPEDSAQANFTDPDSRIMKRAGGGYDASYNAQTAVDDTAHIIVAAELTNNASGAGELPTMLNAVKDNLGRSAEQVLADTGYRSEPVFEKLADCGTQLVVALGRLGQAAIACRPAAQPAHGPDGGPAAKRRRPSRLPAMQVDCRATQRLGEERVGVPTVQHEGAAPSASRVETRVHGAEPQTSNQ